ncbi:MAG: protein kinase [Myxococcales bacterium]|nr:protein kinase [Myxococcales bacterium]
MLFASPESGDELQFAPEGESDIFGGPTLLASGSGKGSWKVLVVDDEPEIHKVTEMTLRDERIDDWPIELLSAHTAEQARHVLTDTPDIALILLDVVMESEHAGLDLVHWIRKELRNRLVRIVLRTGQQGVAPEDRIMADYEINDYWAKTELTAHRLVKVVLGGVRAYRDLCTIGHARTSGAHGSKEPKNLGRYVVIKRVGAGGMGVVYSAYDPELDRKVAIKLMHDQAADSEAQLRLLREAQAMARLSHTNVVAVYDVGTHDGRVFVAMDFINGITLTEWLRRKPRTWEEIVAVFLKAGRGLAAAHEAGLVHRDFKPDNVLVGRKRMVKVTDFGLVTATEAEAEIHSTNDLESIEFTLTRRGTPRASGSALESPLTETGVVMGTPNYMAPEQHLGQESTPRTDQFSFCMALYEALYAAKPYEGQNLAVRLEACFTGRVAPAPRNTGVPSRLRKIVLRGLQWDPNLRWPSMHDLLAALDRPSGVALSRRVALVGGVIAGVGAGVYGVSMLLPREQLTASQQHAKTAADNFQYAKDTFAKKPRDALSIAHDAADDYEKAGSEYRAELAKVKQWIATHEVNAHK